MKTAVWSGGGCRAVRWAGRTSMCFTRIPATSLQSQWLRIMTFRQNALVVLRISLKSIRGSSGMRWVRRVRAGTRGLPTPRPRVRGTAPKSKRKASAIRCRRASPTRHQPLASDPLKDLSSKCLLRKLARILCRIDMRGKTGDLLFDPLPETGYGQGILFVHSAQEVVGHG